MLRATALVALCMLALSWPPRAFACKCAPPPAARDALRSAAAVFEGRVTKLTPLGDDLVIEVSVVRTWKDADSEHLLLRTRASGAACGFDFVPNESYLIYADTAANEANLPGLEVLRCSRTKLMAEADDDISEIGMGIVPVSARGGNLPPGTEPPKAGATKDALSAQRDRPAAGGCASCSSLGAPSSGVAHWPPALAGLALSSCVVMTRRRRWLRAARR